MGPVFETVVLFYLSILLGHGKVTTATVTTTMARKTAVSPAVRSGTMPPYTSHPTTSHSIGRDDDVSSYPYTHPISSPEPIYINLSPPYTSTNYLFNSAEFLLFIIYRIRSTTPTTIPTTFRPCHNLPLYLNPSYTYPRRHQT